MIDSQFNNFKDVYNQLKEASPTSKIYVVGYPQFITSTLNYCGPNTPLNAIERKIMTEGVTYMNQVIKAAASEADVNYIDIEDSMGHHILCDADFSNQYVNGLESALTSSNQEAFTLTIKATKLYSIK